MAHGTLHATYHKALKKFFAPSLNKGVWYVFTEVHVKLVDILFAYQSNGP